MSKGYETLRKYQEAIFRASHGDEAAEKSLRSRLKKTADTMPVPILVVVFQSLLECRREQLRQEAERNSNTPIKVEQRVPATWSTID